MRKGDYFAIEGLDGSGGTTQLGRLAARLESLGRLVVRTREPSDGPVGSLIRAQLAGGVVGDAVLPYLFAADRRDHLDRVVRPALAGGAIVLTDRCALSSFAYQAGALGLGRVMALNEAFLVPRRTFLLTLSPEDCLARIVARGAPRDRFETLERLRLIDRAYTEAVAACRAVGWDIVTIDASPPPEEVAESVWAGAREVLTWPA